MMSYGSFWQIVMIPEFIVEYGKLLSSSGWICSSSYSGIKSSSVSSFNSSCFTTLFSMSCSCVSLGWAFSWWWYIWWIWSYGYSNHTECCFGRGQGIVAWWGTVFFGVSLFYWGTLALIHVCDCSEVVVLWVPLHVCRIVFWRGNVVVFHHVALAVISHLWCWVHNQDNFISGIVFKMFYIFGSIGVDIVD